MTNIRFLSYRISREGRDFEAVINDLGAALPDAVKPYFQAAAAEGRVHPDVYQPVPLISILGYHWSVHHSLTEYVVVIKNLSQDLMPIPELIQLEKMLPDITGRPLLRRGPFTFDPILLNLMAVNKIRGRHWSDGM